MSRPSKIGGMALPGLVSVSHIQFVDDSQFGAQAQVFKIHSLMFLQKIFSLHKGLSKAYFCQMSEEKEKKGIAGVWLRLLRDTCTKGMPGLFALLGKERFLTAEYWFTAMTTWILCVAGRIHSFGYGGFEVLWANLVRGSGLRRQVRTV